MKRKIEIEGVDIFVAIFISDFFVLSLFTYLLNWVYEEWTLWIVCISSIIGVSLFAVLIIGKIIGYIVEQIHFHKLNVYYKNHPEEERKHKEKLAKDFEEIAEHIRKD